MKPIEMCVCKRFRFEAGHHLPFYDGVCKNPHGHTYHLEVTVAGKKLVSKGPKQGMIVDFSDLKAIVRQEVIDKLDHTDLNKLFKNPTAEVMVTWIFGKLAGPITQAFEDHAYLKKVRLWETPDSYAEMSVDG